jgi:hypothetical protein
MANNIHRTILYTAVLSIVCMSALRAADTCTGYDALAMQSNEMADLGHGLTLSNFKAQSVVTSNDAAYNILAGVCAGTELKTADGNTQSTGYCARRNNDGDTESIAWSQAPGAKRGEWKATGGTGKFAGKQDSGWFQQVLADGKISVIQWGGDCH